MFGGKKFRLWSKTSHTCAVTKGQAAEDNDSTRGTRPQETGKIGSDVKVVDVAVYDASVVGQGHDVSTCSPHAEAAASCSAERRATLESDSQTVQPAILTFSGLDSTSSMKSTDLLSSYTQLEDMVRSLAPYKLKSDDLEQRLSVLIRKYERKHSKYKAMLRFAQKENADLYTELSRLKTNCDNCYMCGSYRLQANAITRAKTDTEFDERIPLSAAEIINNLQRRHAALVADNSRQAENYKVRLNEIYAELGTAVQSQKDLRSECGRLRSRVFSLEKQNHKLAELLSPLGRVTTPTESAGNTANSVSSGSVFDVNSQHMFEASLPITLQLRLQTRDSQKLRATVMPSPHSQLSSPVSSGGTQSVAKSSPVEGSWQISQYRSASEQGPTVTDLSSDKSPEEKEQNFLRRNEVANELCSQQRRGEGRGVVTNAKERYQKAKLHKNIGSNASNVDSEKMSGVIELAGCTYGSVTRPIHVSSQVRKANNENDCSAPNENMCEENVEALSVSNYNDGDNFDDCKPSVNEQVVINVAQRPTEVTAQLQTNTSNITLVGKDTSDSGWNEIKRLERSKTSGPEKQPADKVASFDNTINDASVPSVASNTSPAYNASTIDLQNSETLGECHQGDDEENLAKLSTHFDSSLTYTVNTPRRRRSTERSRSSRASTVSLNDILDALYINCAQGKPSKIQEGHEFDESDEEGDEHFMNLKAENMRELEWLNRNFENFLLNGIDSDNGAARWHAALEAEGAKFDIDKAENVESNKTCADQNGAFARSTEELYLIGNVEKVVERNLTSSPLETSGSLKQLACELAQKENSETTQVHNESNLCKATMNLHEDMKMKEISTCTLRQKEDEHQHDKGRDGENKRLEDSCHRAEQRQTGEENKTYGGNSLEYSQQRNRKHEEPLEAEHLQNFGNEDIEYVRQSLKVTVVHEERIVEQEGQQTNDSQITNNKHCLSSDSDATPLRKDDELSDTCTISCRAEDLVCDVSESKEAARSQPDELNTEFTTAVDRELSTSANAKTGSSCADSASSAILTDGEAANCFKNKSRRKTISNCMQSIDSQKSGIKTSGVADSSERSDASGASSNISKGGKRSKSFDDAMLPGKEDILDEGSYAISTDAVKALTAYFESVRVASSSKSAPLSFAKFFASQMAECSLNIATEKLIDKATGIIVSTDSVYPYCNTTKVTDCKPNESSTTTDENLKSNTDSQKYTSDVNTDTTFEDHAKRNRGELGVACSAYSKVGTNYIDDDVCRDGSFVALKNEENNNVEPEISSKSHSSVSVKQTATFEISEPSSTERETSHVIAYQIGEKDTLNSPPCSSSIYPYIDLPSSSFSASAKQNKTSIDNQNPGIASTRTKSPVYHETKSLIEPQRSLSMPSVPTSPSSDCFHNVRVNYVKTHSLRSFADMKLCPLSAAVSERGKEDEVLTIATKTQWTNVASKPNSRCSQQRPLIVAENLDISTVSNVDMNDYGMAPVNVTGTSGHFSKRNAGDGRGAQCVRNKTLEEVMAEISNEMNEMKAPQTVSGNRVQCWSTDSKSIDRNNPSDSYQSKPPLPSKPKRVISSSSATTIEDDFVLDVSSPPRRSTNDSQTIQFDNIIGINEMDGMSPSENDGVTNTWLSNTNPRETNSLDKCRNRYDRNSDHNPSSYDYLTQMKARLPFRHDARYCNVTQTQASGDASQPPVIPIPPYRTCRSIDDAYTFTIPKRMSAAPVIDNRNARSASPMTSSSIRNYEYMIDRQLHMSNRSSLASTDQNFSNQGYDRPSSQTKKPSKLFDTFDSAYRKRLDGFEPLKVSCDVCEAADTADTISYDNGSFSPSYTARFAKVKKIPSCEADITTLSSERDALLTPEAAFALDSTRQSHSTSPAPQSLGVHTVDSDSKVNNIECDTSDGCYMRINKADEDADDMAFDEISRQIESLLETVEQLQQKCRENK